MPESAIVGACRRRRLVERRVRRPVLPDRLVRLLERHLARRDRHRRPPHDAQDAQGRRHAGVRLPDDPGRRRRGDHGHQRLRRIRVLGRPGARPRHRQRRSEPLDLGELARGNYLHWLLADQVRRGQERRARWWTRCSTAAAARATRRSRSRSSATCATARRAGSWGRRTRCCGSSSARLLCSASNRSTTGTRS